jgi:putative PIN family toxin of toxin-antitoxin system
MSRSKPRIVIDSNVVISALVFGGKPRQVLDLLSEDRVSVVIAEEILTELRRKVAVKFPGFMEDLAAVEALLKRDALMVKLGTVNERVSRDPNDDKFIEAAVLGQCSFIASGDNDLLVIGEYQGIRILKPSEFLAVSSD